MLKTGVKFSLPLSIYTLLAKLNLALSPNLEVESASYCLSLGGHQRFLKVSLLPMANKKNHTVCFRRINKFAQIIKW